MSSDRTTFKRSIGLLSGVCFVVGIIIGSGIFISPKGVFIHAQCSFLDSIAVWFVCGLFSMLGSVCYAELGTTFIRSGGDYEYIKSGFGSLLSFLYLWLNLIVIRPASQAILALTFAYYLIGAFNEMTDCSGPTSEYASRIVASLCLCNIG